MLLYSLCFFCLPVLTFSYKILLFVPSLSRSNMILFSRIAQILVKSGNEVHLYRPYYCDKVRQMDSKFGIDIHAQGPSRILWDQVVKLEAQLAFTELSGINEINLALKGEGLMTLFPKMLADSCEAQITDAKLLEKLRNENYDLAVANIYEMCPFGLIKLLNISSYIWLSSSILVEPMADILGVPTPSSYVPGTITEYSDQMTYMERLSNLFNSFGYVNMFSMIIKQQQNVFYKHYGREFPSLRKLAAESQLAFINSEEFLDFPRPIFHKIIYIGGLGLKEGKPLEKEWTTVMNKGKDGVVLMSFGSVVNGSDMPIEWKQSFLKSFANFPNHQFILKYEYPDLAEMIEAKNFKNLFISSWVPQTDILGHPKTVAFITHAGYNSLMESVHAGVPVVCVPLFGDQPRNCRMVEKQKVGVRIQKSEVDENVVTKALRKVIEDKSFLENSKKLSAMMKKKPVKGEELIVKWTEFLAEFKQIPNLQPVGAELGFIQYHCLDVIGGLLIVILLIFYIIYKVITTVCGKLCNKSKKNKKD